LAKTVHNPIEHIVPRNEVQLEENEILVLVLNFLAKRVRNYAV